jgi:hypothetical protein
MNTGLSRAMLPQVSLSGKPNISASFRAHKVAVVMSTPRHQYSRAKGICFPQIGNQFSTRASADQTPDRGFLRKAPLCHASSAIYPEYSLLHFNL